jgi:hypothetical protein
MTIGRTRLGVWRAALLGALALTAAACAKQAEGERCDPLSNSDDCEDGLKCVSLDGLRNGAEGAVCCSDNPSVNICLSSDFDITDGGEPSTNETPVSDAGASTELVSSSLGQSSVDTTASTSAEAGANDAGGVQSTETATSSAPVTISSESTTQVPSSEPSADASSATSSDSADAATPDAG